MSYHHDVSRSSEWKLIGDSDPGDQLIERDADQPSDPSIAPVKSSVVTQISAQVKDPERVSVYLDGEFWVGMSRALSEDLGLKVKQSLNPSERSAIEGAAVEDKAYGWALKRLGERAYPSAKIREKLERKGYDDVIVKTTIRRLTERGYLDDAAYAAALSRQHRDAGYGARRVEQKLRLSGIDPELIKEAVNDSYQDQDEITAASEALERSKWRGRELTRAERRKAMELLIRRGFSPQAASSASAARAMDPASEEEAMGVEQALADLRRRYPRITPERHKQIAYLARRGYSSRVAHSAVDSFGR